MWPFRIMFHIENGVGRVFNQDLTLMIARFLCSLVFIFSAVTKISTWNSAVAEFEGLGIPFVFLPLTILIQLSAGLGLLFGVYARISALLLAGFTLLATLIAHSFWLQNFDQIIIQATVFLEHMAIIGGLLIIASRGAGRYTFFH